MNFSAETESYALFVLDLLHPAKAASKYLFLFRVLVKIRIYNFWYFCVGYAHAHTIKKTVKKNCEFGSERILSKSAEWYTHLFIALMFACKEHRKRIRKTQSLLEIACAFCIHEMLDKHRFLTCGCKRFEFRWIINTGVCVCVCVRLRCFLSLNQREKTHTNTSTVVLFWFILTFIRLQHNTNRLLLPRRCVLCV